MQHGGGGGGGGASSRRKEDNTAASTEEFGPRDPLFIEFAAEAATTRPGDGGGGFGAPATRTPGIDSDDPASLSGLEALNPLENTSDAPSIATLITDSNPTTEVQRSYETLKDEQKRTLFDQVGPNEYEKAASGEGGAGRFKGDSGNPFEDTYGGGDGGGGGMNDGKRATIVPELEARRKRGLDGMEHPAKRTRGEGTSSRAAPGHDIDAAGDVPPPQDAAVPPPQDAHVAPPQDAQADGVPALHPALPHASSEYDNLVLKVKPSVVTVSVVPIQRNYEDTKYRTGFIVSSTNRFAIVFTSLCANEVVRANYSYRVNMEGNIHSMPAEIIAQEESKEFCLLIVKTDKKHQSVSFPETPLTHQRVFTLGAMASTRLRFGGPQIDTLVGMIGQYDGRVLTPDCSAMTLHYKHVQGSEDYFEVRCVGRDLIVELKTIDDRKHEARMLQSAPVFDLNGEVVGLIDSAGTDVDVKNGFKPIVSSIYSMCGRTHPWQVGLLRLGNKMYPEIFGNE